MAKWGKFDFSQFEKFAKTLQRAEKERVNEQFIRDFLVEIANRALRKIKKRTPVGKNQYQIKLDDQGRKVKFKRGKRKDEYKQELSHQGGQLRRNWQVGDVIKQGDNYLIEIFNPTEYSSFVEYGHRQEVGRFVPAIGKRLKEPWVQGRFMMTISMREIERELPKYLEKRMVDLMRNIMNGRPPKGDDS